MRCALVLALALTGCASDERPVDDAATLDAPATDAPASDAPDTGSDGGGQGVLSVIGGFGGGAPVDGPRYHLVAHGFQVTAPTCVGMRCVVGGFAP